MSFQRDRPNGTPNDSRRELESPFVDRELFVDAEVRSTEERASRLIGYQLESPFQYAFEEGYEATVEPEVEALLGERGEEAFAEYFTHQEEAPAAGTQTSGVSPLAIPSIKDWEPRHNRPVEWQGRVYGLVVHTSGGSVPKVASQEGISPTEWAVRYYKRSRGCHYVNGWGGIAGGDLVQVANERVQANGVGVTNKDEPSKDQRRSIELSRFETDLPSILVRLWRKRWPNYKHSLELLPGTRTANSCYIHVECVPCVYHTANDLVTGAQPLKPGLRFTKAQHDAVAHLAVDIARRNGWPAHEVWWRTPRLLGHEDLTPISRHDKNGGWDPGYLREKPYFDWDYVYGVIEQVLQRGAGGPRPSSIGQPISSLFSALGSLVKRFQELIASGQERLAIALAYQQGITDESKLTNLVFFARHPELGGRRIRSDEKELATEWLDIRNQLVRPALPPEQAREMFLAELSEDSFTREAAEVAELTEFLVETDEGETNRFLAEVNEEEFDTEAEEAFVESYADLDQQAKAAEFLEELEADEFDEELDDEGLVTEQVANPFAPRLLDIKATPPSQTLYVEIDLGIGKIAVKLCKKYEKTDGSKKKCIEYDEKFVQVQPKTGIFIPENYSPQLAVDLILYLHGHTIGYPGLNASIDGYWGNPKFPFFALREEVNASKKNVILIAPTLGPKSDAGPWLTSKYGLDRYLDQVLEALKAYGPYQGQSPTIGNIILAGHSGGGSPMQKLALSNNRYRAKIKECWGFDSLYGGVKEGENWMKWAGLNQETDTKAGKKLFIYYYNTKMNSGNLKELARDGKLLDVTVFISKFVSKSSFEDRYKVDNRDVNDHFKVPITYFRERLQDTSFLNKRTSYEQEILTELEFNRFDNYLDEAFDQAFSDEINEEEFDEEERDTEESEEFFDELDEDELEYLVEEESSRWLGTPEQQAFLENVLRAHIARSTQLKGQPLSDLDRAEKKVVPGADIEMRTEAATAAGNLLTAANQALAAAKLDGDTDALKTVRLTANSGYRSRSDQEKIWRKYFPKYYNDTASHRAKLSGGEHGEDAVREMVHYISPKVAAPGFSNHQAGLAIDFWQKRTNGNRIGNSTDPAAVKKWQSTWFFKWLQKSAGRYQFQEYKKEPWHWVYSGPHGLVGAGTERHPQSLPAAPAPQQGIDVEQAIRLNRRYGETLGWHKQQDSIANLLSFTDRSPDERTFAQAVANWQQEQGLSVDGVIGPDTWRQMQKAMGTASAAPTTPTAVTPSTPTMGADEVQRFLTLLGYDLSLKRGADALERALRDFQQDVGIPPSGRLDTKTGAALHGLLDRLQHASNRPPSLQRMSRFRLTSYYVALESSFPDNPVIPVLDQNGQVIAKVDPAFFLSMSVEGTGRLRNGNLLNVVGSREKGGIQDITRYPEYQQLLEVARRYYKKRLKPDRIGATGVRLKDGRVVSVLAFQLVPESKKGKGYGIGRRDIPHEPFKTLAADLGAYESSDPRFRHKGGLVPLGTRVFILELAGVRLPDGTIHDGWCTVNDPGGAIFGAHFDVFTGSRVWSKQANLPEKVHVWFNQSEERCPPDYVYGLIRKK